MLVVDVIGHFLQFLCEWQVPQVHTPHILYFQGKYRIPWSQMRVIIRGSVGYSLAMNFAVGMYADDNDDDDTLGTGFMSRRMVAIWFIDFLDVLKIMLYSDDIKL